VRTPKAPKGTKLGSRVAKSAVPRGRDLQLLVYALAALFTVSAFTGCGGSTTTSVATRSEAPSGGETRANGDLGKGEGVAVVKVVPATGSNRNARRRLQRRLQHATHTCRRDGGDCQLGKGQDAAMSRDGRGDQGNAATIVVKPIGKSTPGERRRIQREFREEIKACQRRGACHLAPPSAGGNADSSPASGHYWRQCEGVIKAPTNRIRAHNLSCKKARDIVREYLSHQPPNGGPEPSPRGFTCNQRPIGGQRDGSPGPYRVACNRTQHHRIEQIRYFWG
jgi:hypothetical protein